VSATIKDAKVKVTVNLPAQQVQFLQTIAEREGVTVTDMLKRAINSEKFFVEAELAHRKILIEDGTRVREVIRR
jgi:hypothetical protein